MNVNKSMNGVKPNIKTLNAEGIVAKRDDSLMKVVRETKRGEVQALGGGRATNSRIPASIECIKVSPFETLTFDLSRDAPIKIQTRFSDSTHTITHCRSSKCELGTGMQPPLPRFQTA